MYFNQLVQLQCVASLTFFLYLYVLIYQRTLLGFMLVLARHCLKVDGKNLDLLTGKCDNRKLPWHLALKAAAPAAVESKLWHKK